MISADSRDGSDLGFMVDANELSSKIGFADRRKRNKNSA